MQQQKNLEEKVQSLKVEIGFLQEELEAAKKAKSSYCAELLNDHFVQERRVEQLALGYEAICEYSEEQLGKVSNLIGVIRGLENTILERQRTIEQIKQKIIAQEEKETATAAIEEPIREFNESLQQFRQAWERLESIALEHDIEIEKQVLPGKAELEEREQAGFANWLKIYFGE